MSIIIRAYFFMDMIPFSVFIQHTGRGGKLNTELDKWAAGVSSYIVGRKPDDIFGFYCGACRWTEKQNVG